MWVNRCLKIFGMHFGPLVNKHGNRKSLRIYVFHVVWCFPMQFYLVTGSWKHYIVTLDLQQTRLTKVLLYEGKNWFSFFVSFYIMQQLRQWVITAYPKACVKRLLHECDIYIYLDVELAL